MRRRSHSDCIANQADRLVNGSLALPFKMSCMDDDRTTGSAVDSVCTAFTDRKTPNPKPQTRPTMFIRAAILITKNKPQAARAVILCIIIFVLS